jgi:hypothetical protein
MRRDNSGVSDPYVHTCWCHRRRFAHQQAAVQAGAEVADTERAVRSVEAKQRGTAEVRRIGELDARQTVEHSAGSDLDEG